MAGRRGLADQPADCDSHARAQPFLARREVGSTPDLSYNSRNLAFALHGASQADDDLYVMIVSAAPPVGQISTDVDT